MRSLRKIVVLLAAALGVVCLLSSQAAFAQAYAPQASYDIDGDGRITGVLDGQNAKGDMVIILRYLFGFRNGFEKLVAYGATRKTNQALLSQLSFLERLGAFDVDGNKAADALSDGILLARFYQGERTQNLTAGAVAPGATRMKPNSIIQFIHSFDS